MHAANVKEPVDVVQQIMSDSFQTREASISEISTLLEISKKWAECVAYLRTRTRWTRRLENILIEMAKRDGPCPNMNEWPPKGLDPESDLITDLTWKVNFCNKGRGFNAGKDMADFLRNDNKDKAYLVWVNDGDKFGQYPEIRELAEKLLGCRIHGKKDCDGPFCKRK